MVDPYEKIGFGDRRFPYKKNIGVLMIIAVFPYEFIRLLKMGSDPYEKIGFGDRRFPYENIWVLMIIAIFPMNL